MSTENEPTIEEAAFKVYPSGFLGSHTVPTTKPIDIEKIKDRLFDLSAISNPDGHTANLEVTRLWDKVTQGSPEYKTFDFKEAVLVAALNAFGAMRVIDWLRIQPESPYYSDYHARWVDETLAYVFEGKARLYSTHNWTTLLQLVPGVTLKGLTSGTKHYFYQDTNFKPLAFIDYPTPNLLMTDFITKWVSQPFGIDDLVASLYVLFGERQ